MVLTVEASICTPMPRVDVKRSGVGESPSSPFTSAEYPDFYGP